MKLLLIEDEKELAGSVVSYLEEEGHSCEWAPDYESAMQLVGLAPYDCFIVDITLPGGSGLDIIRDIKKMNILSGIIIISARNSVDQRIEGLEIGADDYLAKPFHLAELNAHLKSIHRRISFQGCNEIVFNEIKIVPDEHKVFVNYKEITLTKKEFELLIFFVANKNRVITKTTLAEHLWGDDLFASGSYDFIYTHIKNLRKKLLDNDCADYIKTVYGIGYKFEEN